MLIRNCGSELGNLVLVKPLGTAHAARVREPAFRHVRKRRDLSMPCDLSRSQMILGIDIKTGFGSGLAPGLG